MTLSLLQLSPFQRLDDIKFSHLLKTQDKIEIDTISTVHFFQLIELSVTSKHNTIQNQYNDSSTHLLCTAYLPLYNLCTLRYLVGLSFFITNFNFISFNVCMRRPSIKKKKNENLRLNILSCFDH